MNITILYEDRDLFVIDKPSGVVVNRAESVRGETVQDFVEDKRLRSRIQDPGSRNKNKDFYNRSGIVHRLDKETSGVLVVAKNYKSFVDLQKQFKKRTIKKEYIALVHGDVTMKEGVIKVPVGRTPWDRQKFGVLASGRASQTKFKVDRYIKIDNKNFTLLKLYPLTGRTHQIRVHLKYFGHPIVSDSKYLGKRLLREDKKWCPRLFLHAGRITFTHSRTGKKIEIKSQLPRDLKHATEM